MAAMYKTGDFNADGAAVCLNPGSTVGNDFKQATGVMSAHSNLPLYQSHKIEPYFVDMDNAVELETPLGRTAGSARLLPSPGEDKSKQPSSVRSKSKTIECKPGVSEIRNVPAKAMNVATRKRLSLLMRPPKLNGNDWKGLAELMGFEYLQIENFDLNDDPMKTVLDEWTCFRDKTMGVILDMLEELERDDVLMDITPFIEKDAIRWIEKRKNAVQVPEVSGSYPNLPDEPQLRGITLDDHPSGPPEVFDAYVCFTYADKEFVMKMMSILENAPYNLKLCVDFRDLVPGGSYSTITAELIENRCKRMIIVLSPDFLASEDCDFQTKFAHSIGPSARSKRLIPVMVECCAIPAILRHVTVCDYTKTDLRPWFWKRLYCALKSSTGST